MDFVEWVWCVRSEDMPFEMLLPCGLILKKKKTKLKNGKVPNLKFHNSFNNCGGDTPPPPSQEYTCFFRNESVCTSRGDIVRMFFSHMIPC